MRTLLYGIGEPDVLAGAINGFGYRIFLRHSFNWFTFQLCAHKFCSECIQNMVAHETIPYPIVCPADGCNTQVCLKDIQAIAPVSVQEKIGEAAVNALRRDPKFEDKYRSCFKTGCEQLVHTYTFIITRVATKGVNLLLI